MSSAVCPHVMFSPVFVSGHIPRILVLRRKSMYSAASKLRIFALVLALVSLVALGSGPVYGQAINGNIVGTVTDPSGAAVSNADVTGTNPATGFTVTSKTNDTGGYRFDNLPVGDYRVTTRAAGFRTWGPAWRLRPCCSTAR